MEEFIEVGDGDDLMIRREREVMDVWKGKREGRGGDGDWCEENKKQKQHGFCRAPYCIVITSCSWP